MKPSGAFPVLTYASVRVLIDGCPSEPGVKEIDGRASNFGLQTLRQVLQESVWFLRFCKIIVSILSIVLVDSYLMLSEELVSTGIKLAGFADVK